MTPQTSRSEALMCTVVSFVPFDIFEEKPGLIPGRFAIPASDTKIPQVKHIPNDIFHYVYLDETRPPLPARDPADEVAKSIVNDFVNSQLGISETAQPALFWLPGKITAAEVLMKYKEKCDVVLALQNNWFNNLIKIADDDWTRYQKHTVISDFQRRIAGIKGLTAERHPWIDVGQMPQTVSCPACHSPVSPEAAICSVCRAVINKDKAAKFEFAS